MATFNNNGPIYLTASQYEALSPKEVGQEYCITGELTIDDISNLKCTQTTAGTYVLKATVSSTGTVTYSWVAET